MHFNFVKNDDTVPIFNEEGIGFLAGFYTYFEVFESSIGIVYICYPFSN